MVNKAIKYVYYVLIVVLKIYKTKYFLRCKKTYFEIHSKEILLIIEYNIYTKQYIYIFTINLQ